MDLGAVLPVVPVPVRHPLPQQLDGRLRAILLLGRHVQVVDKHHALLAHRRSKNTLATPAHSTHAINVKVIHMKIY